MRQRRQLRLVDPNTAQSMPGPRRATLVGVDPEGRVLAVIDGSPSAVTCSLATAFSDRVLVAAVRARADVLVEFIGGDPSRPVILGLLRDRISLGEGPGEAERPPHSVTETTESITLACGDAQIQLRADGRVEIRGTHVVSTSSGTNIVQGTSVRIN